MCKKNKSILSNRVFKKKNTRKFLKEHYYFFRIQKKENKNFCFINFLFITIYNFFKIKMLKFKGNISAKNVVDAMIKGKPNPLRKRKFTELEVTQSIQASTKSNELEKESLDSSKKFKTTAELSFDLVKKKRILDRIDKKLETSHKEKIEKFNKGLSKLSDHFDIPRVGPG